MTLNLVDEGSHLVLELIGSTTSFMIFEVALTLGESSLIIRELKVLQRVRARDMQTHIKSKGFQCLKLYLE